MLFTLPPDHESWAIHDAETRWETRPKNDRPEPWTEVCLCCYRRNSWPWTCRFLKETKSFRNSPNTPHSDLRGWYNIISRAMRNEKLTKNMRAHATTYDWSCKYGRLYPSHSSIVNSIALECWRFHVFSVTWLTRIQRHTGLYKKKNCYDQKQPLWQLNCRLGLPVIPEIVWTTFSPLLSLKSRANRVEYGRKSATKRTIFLLTTVGCVWCGLNRFPISLFAVRHSRIHTTSMVGVTPIPDWYLLARRCWMK